ncbi:hypothetical protein ACHWQZ_G001256 [Mnemiopsis leidyi]
MIIWIVFLLTTSTVICVTASDGWIALNGAPDYYGPAICTGLTKEWTSMLETTTPFPVDTGTVLELSCSNYAAVNEGSGSSEVTCITGTAYSFSKEPICSIQNLTRDLFYQEGVITKMPALYDLSSK